MVKHKRHHRYRLLLIALPFLLLILLFNYMPVVGWAYSLFDYIPGIPLKNCDFVGLKYFKMLFTDQNTLRVMKNTLIFAGITIVLTPLPMFFAMLLNEVGCKPVQKVIQTFTTLPNFISWVIVYSLAFSIFSYDGLWNSILQTFGVDINASNAYSVMGDENAVYWFQSALQIWKTLGWNAIVYLAAITGIDEELYNAAKVDGAGHFRCALHVTLPALAETYFVLLMLAIGNILNTGFEQYFLFKNSQTARTIEVLDLYVYRIGLESQDYSYGVAIGIMKTIVSIILLTLANKAAKKIRGQSII